MRAARQWKPRFGAPLSPREAQVVALIAESKIEREIAAELHISPRSVKFFVSQAFRKSGTRTRAGLMVWWARSYGAVAPDRNSISLDGIGRLESELAAARVCLAGVERALTSLKFSIANGAAK